MHESRVGDLGVAEYERLQTGQVLEVYESSVGDRG